MYKFGFIAHPLSLNHYLSYSKFPYSLIQYLPSYYSKRLMLRFPPYKIFELIIKLEEEIIKGIIINCPLTPDQMVKYKTDISLPKIEKACQIAINYGAKIIGLGGFTSIISNSGKEINLKSNAQFTTGNTYTSCLVVDSILDIAKKKHKEINNLNLTVIGAYGDIGSACSRYLAKYIKHINLVGRDHEKLERIKKDVQEINSNAIVKCFRSPDEIVSNSDIVITATSSLTTFISSEQLKNDAIVCDVSYPANIQNSLSGSHGNLTIYEGGMATANFLKLIDPKTKKEIFDLNKSNSLHGCVCETIMLSTIESKMSFSKKRGNISIDDIDFIRSKANKFGFNYSME